jgi:hypothetical protein
MKCVDSFLLLWGAITFIGGFFIFLSSGLLFLHSYANPTFEQWRFKINREFPTPEMVKNEILMTCKGLVTATFCPTLSLYIKSNPSSPVSQFLASYGIVSNSYCGVHPTHGVVYDVMLFLLVWFVSDFYEFFYHWCGHYFTGNT